MNKIRTVLKISIALLCILALGFGISIAITMQSLSTENEKVKQAQTTFAKAQILIDDNPQIVVAVAGEGQEKEVTLQKLREWIRTAREMTGNHFEFAVIANPNSNSQELTFRGLPHSAKDIIPFIEKIENSSYPAKATAWTMRRDTNSGMWKNIRINFTLPKKPKDAK